MQPSNFKETGRIKKIIKDLTKYTVSKFKDKGMVSLYLAGTILTKDRTPYSDIDLFGFVGSDFDIIKEENIINAEFEAAKKELCGGFEVRFRAIGLDELEGGGPRGTIAKHVGLDVAINYFPFYKRLWGKRLNFKKFPIKPLALREMAKRQIQWIENYINEFRKGKEIVPRSGLGKFILALARTEAQKDYGFKFDPSYLKLTKHLKKERNHIAHKAMAFRYKPPTKEETLEFCNEIEVYIKHIKKRISEWT